MRKQEELSSARVHLTHEIEVKSRLQKNDSDIYNIPRSDSPKMIEKRISFVHNQDKRKTSMEERTVTALGF